MMKKLRASNVQKYYDALDRVVSKGLKPTYSAVALEAGSVAHAITKRGAHIELRKVIDAAMAEYEAQKSAKAAADPKQVMLEKLSTREQTLAAEVTHLKLLLEKSLSREINLVTQIDNLTREVRELKTRTGLRLVSKKAEA